MADGALERCEALLLDEHVELADMQSRAVPLRPKEGLAFTQHAEAVRNALHRVAFGHLR